MATSTKPKRLIVRSYQVGFGDCFLLTFDYGKRKKHILIDFGSKAQPDGTKKGVMKQIALDIQKECGGKLHAVVATHRHQDHISGFTTTTKKDGAGDIIRALKPDLVVQPWTEDPKAKSDSTGPIAKLMPVKAATRALEFVHQTSQGLLPELNELRRQVEPAFFRMVMSATQNNVKNPEAVANLRTMSKRRTFVYFGAKSGLESVLPGVRIRVLGPPTLKQSSKVRSERTHDDAEFWHLQARTSDVGAERTRTLFPRRYVVNGNPISARWERRRLARLRSEAILELVRSMDGVLNNTSVILLFKIGTKAFLFPGDAQIENWEYALAQKDVAADLKKTVLYKVGHHGSLNATPKTLWNLFTLRSKKKSTGRLKTTVSTLAGYYGSTDRGTEVPRAKLITALRAESDYFSTQMLKGGVLRRDVTFDF